jgi:hypothetical protein
VSVEPPDGDVVSAADASALTGVPMETMRNWRDEGKGPPFTKQGRFYYYDRADLESYVRPSADTMEAGRQDDDQREQDAQFVIPDGWQDWEPVVKIKSRLTVLGSAPMHGHWACPLCDSRWDPYRWHKGFLNLPTQKPPTLVVSETLDGHASLHDQGGHSQAAILAALGLSDDDLRPTVQLVDGTRAQQVFTYSTMDGQPIYQKLQGTDGANWRHQTEDGWNWGRGNQPPQFWRLRDVRYAVQANAYIYLAVDERAVMQRMHRNGDDPGVLATTVAGGLGNFHYQLACDLVGSFKEIRIDTKASDSDAIHVARILANVGLQAQRGDPSGAMHTHNPTALLRGWTP